MDKFMWFRVTILLVAGAILLAIATIRSAHAESMCVPVEIPRDIALKRGAHWLGVTPERYRFLEGISVMAPEMPVGLPPGAAAILSWKDDEKGAAVWFIDGETACGPMDIPQSLVDMMERLYEVKHVGSGL